MYKKLSVLFFVGFILASCGFRPVYDGRGDGNVAVRGLERIEIAPIPDRIGQMMHNDLSTLLQPKGLVGPATHGLSIEIDESTRHLNIQKDATATRANLIIKATYVLTAKETNAVVFQDSTTMQMSYNLLPAVYATRAAEEAARRRGVREIAKNIRGQLAVYFTRRSETGR